MNLLEFVSSRSSLPTKEAGKALYTSMNISKEICLLKSY